MATFWNEDEIASIPWEFMKMKKNIEKIKEIYLCPVFDVLHIKLTQNKQL